MFVRIKSTPNSPRKSVQIVEGFRDKKTGKVKQRIIRHVGIALDELEEKKLRDLAEEIIIKIKELAEEESTQLSMFKDLSPNHSTTIKKLGRPKKKNLENIIKASDVTLGQIVEEARIIEGIHQVVGYVFDDIYKKLLQEKNLSKSDYIRIRDLTLARISDPESKRKSQINLSAYHDQQHDLDALYRSMDKVFVNIDNIKLLTFNKTKNLFPDNIDLLLFDVTTLYFESIEQDELRNYGYSKDHRFNTTQVVLALATNKDGLPIGYELFEGNKAEVKTLVAAIKNWKKLFTISDICFVGDRAMFCKENIKILEEEGYSYIIAAKLKSMNGQLKNKILNHHDNYSPAILKNELSWIGEFAYENNARLIVSYKNSRAINDQKQREKIIEKITKTLGKQVNKDGSSAKKAITNSGIKKYTSTDDKSKIFLDQDKIILDEKWDGLHGVITNIKPEKKDGIIIGTAISIIQRYARLWVIEESFRINKHNLAMRPIYHFKPERIHAHIAICYMAFATMRMLEYQVNLTKKISSINEIREELKNVQSSIYRHKITKDLYRMPGKFTHRARKIYEAFNLKYSEDAEIYFKEQEKMIT
jgi:transposase